MTKTNYKVRLVSEEMGWNITRNIYMNNNCDWFVMINGDFTSFDWCISKCDDYNIIPK